MKKTKLKALFYPDVPFDSLFIPFIYKEIYFDGVYIDVLNQQKDMMILDIGANIGVVTQHLKDYAKKIIAVEPSQEHFTALKKNVEFNRWDNVTPVHAAIADKDGEMILYSNTQNRTCHSLTNNYNQGGETVKTYSFDTLFKEHKLRKVDFMKFDVEGAEDMILRSEGFKKIVRKIDKMMIAFHYQTFPQLVKYIEELGYESRRYPCQEVLFLFTKIGK